MSDLVTVRVVLKLDRRMASALPKLANSLGCSPGQLVSVVVTQSLRHGVSFGGLVDQLPKAGRPKAKKRLRR